MPTWVHGLAMGAASRKQQSLHRGELMMKSFQGLQLRIGLDARVTSAQTDGLQFSFL